MLQHDDYADVGVLVGKTIEKIDRVNDDELRFFTKCGREFRMLHEQNCCEHVHLEEIIGDLDDLVGVTMIEADEVSNKDEEGERPSEYSESWTWTFYKFRTHKGDVTLRWLGESNGYYGEGVDFIEKGGK